MSPVLLQGEHSFLGFQEIEREPLSADRLLWRPEFITKIWNWLPPETQKPGGATDFHRRSPEAKREDCLSTLHQRMP